MIPDLRWRMSEARREELHGRGEASRRHARGNTGPDGAVGVAVDHRFAVSLREGFDYITDPANWPEYWPGLVAIEPGSRWERPGDRARLSLRLMGRQTELVMTLGKLEPYKLVSYRSEQRGLPSAEHERHFSDAGHGFDYRLVVRYQPRRGPRGFLDRTIFRRAVRRALEETVENLSGVSRSGGARCR